MLMKLKEGIITINTLMYIFRWKETPYQRFLKKKYDEKKYLEKKIRFS